MPYKFAVECICDKLAATKTYAGGKYTPDMPLIHWNKYGSRAVGNPRTMKFINQVFLDLAEHGDSYVLNKKYLKKTYDNICISKEITLPTEQELPLYNESTSNQI